VIEALCFKPEGRGYEIRLSELIFLICLTLSATLGPGITQPLTEMGTRSRRITLMGSGA
jgi:hypothetical protein